MFLFSRVCRWPNVYKILSRSISETVWLTRNRVFISALLWEAKLSMTALEDPTKWWRTELQKKFGCSISFAKMKTDVRIHFPIYFDVWLSFNLSSCRTKVSKPTENKSLKTVSLFKYSKQKEIIKSKKFSVFHKRPMDKRAGLFYCFQLKLTTSLRSTTSEIKFIETPWLRLGLQLVTLVINKLNVCEVCFSNL